MADIFISYTSSDRDWAFWIAKELRGLGHAPHIHEWEIDGGNDIYAWMEQRSDAADHVLCVVSDDYLTAPYSTLERNGALWRAAKQPGFALFVAVRPCKLPTLADHIRRCELFGVPEDAARIRFHEFMCKREEPAAIAFPGRIFAVSNIPIRVPAHFLGREDSLAAIDTTLSGSKARLSIAVLHGLRGVGKTTLAAAYAERHRGDYRATWWIRAQTEPNMRADLIALGVRLNWVGPDEKEERALAIVAERLRYEGEGILLIFDNALDAGAVKPYLPRGGVARVLVTSNAHAWRDVALPLEIRLWPTEIGADYLTARTGRAAERAAAKALCDALGGLPLAHEQAAAYCERLEVPLAEYNRRFETAPARMLDNERDAPAEYHDRLTVAKTFALAIDEAAKLHCAAEPLIVHAALLAPEPIPLFLFAEAREKLGEPLASRLADDGLDEAVAALRTFALLDRNVIADERDPAITTECIRLHRLVHRVARMRLAGAACEDALRALVEATAAVYPDGIYNDATSWPRARRLDALALALVGGEMAPLAGEEQQCVKILNGLAGYRHAALGAYAQAQPLFERALAISDERLGREHPDTAASLGSLAIVLQAQGERARARLLLERALATYQKTHGPEHPDTATCLNNLAILVEEQGDLTASRNFKEQALAIRKKVLGPEHPDTAASLNNLAFLLWIQGDLAGARPLYEQALAIWETALGTEHPNTNRGRRNLARILIAENRPAEALALGKAALAAHDKALGRDHTWTKDSARVTADALDALGRTGEAAALREGYAIGEHGKDNVSDR